MSTHTNVPIRANKPYTQALKALAYQHGMTVGELVRSAIDQVYSEQLAPHLAFFKADDGYQSSQLDTEEDEEPEVAHG